MATRTANAVTGNASAGSSWVGGVAPVNGDIAVIPVGADITWDYDVTLGSSSVHAGIALYCHGASVSSFGRVTVAPGVTLTLKSQDEHSTGTDFPLITDQWGQFVVGPDAIVEFEIPAADASWVINNGIFHAIGTPGHLATVRTTAANRVWNTAGSFTRPNISQWHDRDTNLNCFPLGNGGISNAAGTAQGSLGDSSLTFSVGATLFTTEVASQELVLAAGDYFVDYLDGILYYYEAPPNSTAWTANYTYLTYNGVSVQSQANTDGNEFVTQYCNWQYMGSMAESGKAAIQVAHKRVGSGVSRAFQVTNCAFLYCSEVIGYFDDVSGVLGNPVLITDNTFHGLKSQDPGFGGILAVATSTSSNYVSVLRNTGANPAGYFIIGLGEGGTFANWTVDDNAINASALIRGGLNAIEAYWPDLHLGSFMYGLGSLDSRAVHQLRGTPGHPVVIEMIGWRGHRFVNLTTENQLLNSLLACNSHHAVMGRVANTPEKTTGVVVDHNLLLDNVDNGVIQTCYNGFEFVEGAEVTHNTVHGDTAAYSGLTFGDQSDPQGSNLITRLTQSSNLVTSGAYGIRRTPDDTIHFSRVHVAGMDYNCLFGNATADYSGLSRFATFSGIVNVAGCSLFNPTYSAPFSGKSLALVVTSPTNQTLAWDGGTPVQLVYRTSTATGSSNHLDPTTALSDYGTLQDTTQAWVGNTSYTDPNCPIGYWVVITGGTGAGQIRRIPGIVSATEVYTVPSWTTPPDATSTYALVQGEVVLTASDGVNTVNCGVDLSALPATSQTDAAIAMTLNSLSVDPQYVDDTRTLASWDASLGGAGTETSARARLFAQPTLANSSFKPYMFAGFTPKNTALKGAAHDGTDIGAVPVLVPASSGLLQMTCLQRIGV